MREELIREILDKALEQELGMVVTCDNLHRTTVNFHNITKNNPKYAELMICAGSKPDQMLITKRTVELGDAREPTDET